MSRSIRFALLTSVVSFLSLAVIIVARGTAPEPELLMANNSFILWMIAFFTLGLGSLAGAAAIAYHQYCYGIASPKARVHHTTPQRIAGFTSVTPEVA